MHIYAESHCYISCSSSLNLHRNAFTSLDIIIISCLRTHSLSAWFSFCFGVCCFWVSFFFLCVLLDYSTLWLSGDDWPKYTLSCWNMCLNPAFCHRTAQQAKRQYTNSDTQHPRGHTETLCELWPSLCGAEDASECAEFYHCNWSALTVLTSQSLCLCTSRQRCTFYTNYHLFFSSTAAQQLWWRQSFPLWSTGVVQRWRSSAIYRPSSWRSGGQKPAEPKEKMEPWGFTNCVSGWPDVKWTGAENTAGCDSRRAGLNVKITESQSVWD